MLSVGSDLVDLSDPRALFTNDATDENRNGLLSSDWSGVNQVAAGSPG